ncbi:MAG TPA: hypothetical protein DHU96_34325, partial [Actinobacteria bacterium]|nr:hypothetical protein [Actinomycetota bacterium]
CAGVQPRRMRRFWERLAPSVSGPAIRWSGWESGAWWAQGQTSGRCGQDLCLWPRAGVAR